MARPCDDKFDDWKDAYEEWEEADADANEAFKDSMVATGASVATCVGTWWTGIGLLGCVVTGAAALNEDYDSIEASKKRNKKFHASEKAKQAYEKCVNDHKKYYRN